MVETLHRETEPLRREMGGAPAGGTRP